MALELISQAPSGEAHPTPILFVHGAWHGAWCWQATFMPYFAERGYRTYALSYRGHGSSPGKVRWASVAGYVADIAEAAQKVEAETGRAPIVIGHSLGGFLVQKYLEQHSAPAAVLLASLPSRGVLPFLVRYTVRHPLINLWVTLTATTYHIVSTPERAREMFFSADAPQALVQNTWQKLVNESFRVIFDASVLLPRPSRVKTPILALGAEYDAFFPPHEIQATARAYGTEARIFPSMAHNMMMEKDWQSVADAIIEWLAAQRL